MNNIEERLCQSRIKEIAEGSSPLIGEKERLALTALHWHQEHRIAVQAFQETGRNLLLAQEQIADLIAQLEAAHKEISELREEEQEWLSLADMHEHLNHQNNLNVEHRNKIHDLKEKLLAAEAALSAANEKLVVPVVLPDDGLEDCINMWPDNWRNDFDTGYNFGIWRCEQNIKKAGFTVEGE